MCEENGGWGLSHQNPYPPKQLYDSGYLNIIVTPMTGIKYTKEEEAIIRENYGNTPTTEWLHSLNNRLLKSIQQKAFRMGLAKTGQAWNKGLTKETSEIMRKMAEGTSRTRKKLFAEGKLKVPWEGMKCPGRGGAPKGVLNKNKNKTYEEIYGVDKANEIKDKWLKAMKEHWQTHDAWNKGKPIPKNHPLWNHMFKKGQEAWNKGLPLEQQPGYGYERSKETREKISKSRLGKTLEEIIGSKEKAEKTRKKLSESHIGISAITEIGREKLRRQRLFMVIPSKDTKIEKKVQEELTKNNVLYTKHYPIKGQPDIAIPEKKIAIFIDGCYWHDCPICNLEEPRKNIRKKDEQITEYLEKEGWKVMRFWEHEINKDLQQTINKIIEVIKK